MPVKIEESLPLSAKQELLEESQVDPHFQPYFGPWPPAGFEATADTQLQQSLNETDEVQRAGSADDKADNSSPETTEKTNLQDDKVDQDMEQTGNQEAMENKEDINVQQETTKDDKGTLDKEKTNPPATVPTERVEPQATPVQNPQQSGQTNQPSSAPAAVAQPSGVDLGQGGVANQGHGLQFKRVREEVTEFSVQTTPPPILSEKAIDSRLRRIFTPKADGRRVVDESWYEQWTDKSGGRAKTLEMFEKRGYVAERVVKKYHKVKKESFFSRVSVFHTPMMLPKEI